MNLDNTLKIIVNALEDVKGENIVTINTTNLSALFNYIIVCSGNSTRQTNALANNLISDLKDNQIEIIGVEGTHNGEWVLVDCGAIVVHIMLPSVRTYYNLESLWDDNHTSNDHAN